MNNSLLLAASIVAALIGGPVRDDPITVKGLVLDPTGAPVRAALVTATTSCGVMVLDQVGSTQTDHEGQFVLKIIPEHCGQVLLQASKEEEFWLLTGEWERVLDNAGTAPVIDLKVERSDAVVIHLGSRGGELAIETTDEKHSFWPSVVFVNRCGSNGSASGTFWSPMSVEAPTSVHLLPEGTYCAGVASANEMFPTTSTCTKVEVVAGQRRSVSLIIDPLTLTTKMVPPRRDCSEQPARNEPDR
jgi:hypothetical protein